MHVIVVELPLAGHAQTTNAQQYVVMVLLQVTRCVMMVTLYLVAYVVLTAHELSMVIHAMTLMMVKCVSRLNKLSK